MDERRLAVEHALANAFADVDNDFISWTPLKNLMTTVFPDHVTLRWWFDKFIEFQNNGGLTRQPNEAPWFEKLRDELRIALNQRVNISDDLTRISALNWKKNLWKNYSDYNPEIFIRPMLRQDGVMYHIWGIPGFGKTDFCLLQVEEILKHNFTVVTNIYSPVATLIRYGNQIPSKDEVLPNFFRTVRMSDLLYKMVTEIELGHHTAVALDEMSAWMHKQDSGSKENVDFSRLIRLIRKFNGNIFFLEQIDEGLSSVTNEMLRAKFFKEEQKKVHFMTRYEESNYNLYLNKVPPTKIPFKSGDFAGFIPDVDFKHMFKKIAIDDQGDKIPEIKKYLEDIFMKSKRLKKTKRKKQ